MNDTNVIQKASWSPPGSDVNMGRLAECICRARTGCGVSVGVDIIQLVHFGLHVRVEGDVYKKCDKRRCTRKERCE